jgi:putative photosynthetic complex assembly protein 2
MLDLFGLLPGALRRLHLVVQHRARAAARRPAAHHLPLEPGDRLAAGAGGASGPGDTAAPWHATGGAYCAFTCALLVWGWHELSFLTGWITGPRRAPARPARGLARFVQAVQAILWHELAILAGRG